MHTHHTKYAHKTHNTKHAHQAQHTKHAHQAQNSHHHAFMYAKVFTCTYCDRNGHLAKFCYNKLNLEDRNIWILIPKDPKGYGYQNQILLLLLM